MVEEDLAHRIRSRSDRKESAPSTNHTATLGVQRVSEILRQAQPHLRTRFCLVASILACCRSYG
jgi:hypothetical protein